MPRFLAAKSGMSVISVPSLVMVGDEEVAFLKRLRFTPGVMELINTVMPIAIRLNARGAMNSSRKP